MYLIRQVHWKITLRHVIPGFIGNGRRDMMKGEVKFVSIEELPRGESLLEKDIVYTKSGKLYRGTVIGRVGHVILIRRKSFFDGKDEDRKEKVGIEGVIGVVKKEEGNGDGS